MGIGYKQKTHFIKRKKGGITYPLQFKPLADRREEEGRCPDCGRNRGCYECATRGGWISETELEEIDQATG